MQTVIRLKLDELNPSLISSIKSLYKNKEIEIIMHDVKDETEYLKENSNNHKFLLKQIAIVKKNKDLLSMSSLKHEYKGYWSRRINHEHRLIYKVTESEIIFISCKHHY